MRSEQHEHTKGGENKAQRLDSSGDEDMVDVDADQSEKVSSAQGRRGTITEDAEVSHRHRRGWDAEDRDTEMPPPPGLSRRAQGEDISMATLLQAIQKSDEVNVNRHQELRRDLEKWIENSKR